MKPHPYRLSLGHMTHPDDAWPCCHLPEDHPIHHHATTTAATPEAAARIAALAKGGERR